MLAINQALLFLTVASHTQAALPVLRTGRRWTEAGAQMYQLGLVKRESNTTGKAADMSELEAVGVLCPLWRVQLAHTNTKRIS